MNLQHHPIRLRGMLLWVYASHIPLVFRWSHIISSWPQTLYCINIHVQKTKLSLVCLSQSNLQHIIKYVDFTKTIEGTYHPQSTIFIFHSVQNDGCIVEQSITYKVQCFGKPD